MIKNRSELLFLYDVTNANPNGDPSDENKPRIDEETGINIVTDVRLKRTIRDYFFNYTEYNGSNQKDIFIREKRDTDGYVLDVKKRLMEFVKDDYCSSDEKVLVEKFLGKSKICKSEAINLIKIFEKTVIKECIDTRLFGSVYPVEFPKSKMDNNKEFKSSIKLTGAVQFKMGYSLHCVELQQMPHSFSMSSGDSKDAGSLATEYILPYSLISFYGVINENAAKATKLTHADVDLLKEGIWEGTKNLLSRSKMGHSPRLLMRVEYKEPNFFIGELDKYISLVTEKKDEEIRDIEEVKIDLTRLAKELNKHERKIEKIELKLDSRIKLIGKEILPKLSEI